MLSSVTQTSPSHDALSDIPRWKFLVPNAFAHTLRSLANPHLITLPPGYMYTYALSTRSPRLQWTWALTLHELLVKQGRLPKDLVATTAAKILMHNTLMNTSFDGVSGRVHFDPVTGDRLGLTIVIRNQVDGVEKTIARYQKGAFVPASMDVVVWWYNFTSGNKSLSSGEGFTPRDRSPLRQPTVTGVAPRFVSPFGGETITIMGHNFRAGALSVTTGGKACASPTRLSPSTISCVTPAGEGAELSVQVTIDGVSSAPAIVFAYNLPRISTLSRGVFLIGRWH